MCVVVCENVFVRVREETMRTLSSVVGAPVLLREYVLGVVYTIRSIGCLFCIKGARYGCNVACVFSGVVALIGCL